jgi:hypothetical protein
MISRLHAIIREEIVNGMKRYKIVDNSSINGVIVNGIRVKEAILEYDLDSFSNPVSISEIEL